MKRNLLTVFVTALCFLLFLSLNSCTRNQVNKPVPPAKAQDIDIEYLKQWFHTKWQHPSVVEASTARASTWDHDTAFIQNNYANLTPEWHLAKVYYKDNVKFTEVPAEVKDTLQFKLAAMDSLSLFAQLSDSSFQHIKQSKIFLIIKEAPGEDIYAETVTFIGDYEYTKADYQRFSNSISYFDLTGFTGVVQYHNKIGALLRHFEYLRGQLINTVRCTSIPGLDPAPDNRASQPKCYEVLTWERQCVTTFTQYGSFTECGEWFLVGSYMVGNCLQSDEGVTGGVAATYEPVSEDGLDCGSLEFKSTAGNWQEAGLRKARVNFRWIGGSKSGEYINITLGAPIVFGLPKVREDGTTYSPGAAAQLAAEANDYAHFMTAQALKFEPYRPKDNAVEETFRKWVDLFMKNHGGSAGRTGSSSPNIVFRDAQYRLLGNGNCK